jgi:hypothetical protein
MRSVEAPDELDGRGRSLFLAGDVSDASASESICPIALFELGAWSERDTPLVVGTHPLYPRRIDVIEQLRLARPAVSVVATLDELAASIAPLFA